MVAGAPVDDGLARHLFSGKRLPDIALPSTYGRMISPSRLDGRAVLVIYPWTGRPGFSNPPHWDYIAGAHGSTPAAEEFRNAFEEFECRGIGVFGLSTQPADYHRELAMRLQLNFPILSDENFQFASALGLPQFETAGTHYLKRLTILANQGVIERVWYPVRDPVRQGRDVLDVLQGV